MVELRLNQATGKYEKPGPATFGRVYMVVDPMTGEVAYNCTLSDLPGLDPEQVQRISKYDSFAGWMTEIVSTTETLETVKRLNNLPKEFKQTKHTKLVARVKQRLAEQHAGTIDGFSALDDMREMYADILGQRIRPALPGWST